MAQKTESSHTDKMLNMKINQYQLPPMIQITFKATRRCFAIEFI